MMDAAEDLPIARARNSEPWDCHWDAPAFAANLRNAAAGDGFRKMEAKSGRRASQQVVSTFIKNKAPGCKVQKLATKAFSEALYPSKISKTLACRFERCFPNEENMPSLEDWKAYITELRKCRPSVATANLKSILNGWTTSHRMHEEVLRSCIFGCAHGADQWRHYAESGILWCHCGFTDHSATPRPIVTSLGIKPVDTDSMLRVATLFLAYHAIEFGVLKVNDGIGTEGNIVPPHVAETYARNAVERAGASGLSRHAPPRCEQLSEIVVDEIVFLSVPPRVVADD